MCARTDWPCVRDGEHVAPKGCVHTSTSGIASAQHEDDGGE